MDRHQFVQSLIGKREEAAKTLEDLKKESRRAFRRTRTAIAELLAEPKPNGQFSVSLSSCWNGEARMTFPEGELVSDEAIISLCGEICSLRKQCDEERSKIDRYSREDVATRLKQLIESC